MQQKWVVLEAKSPPPEKPVPLVLLIFLLFCAGLVVAALLFTFNTQAAAAILRVTPIDTSPDTLDVTVTIFEDQEATDARSNITLSFSTIVIKEKNYVRFDQPNDAVLCNGVTQALGASMQYTVYVQHKDYICDYSGNKDGRPLPYVQMFAVALGSALSPQPPTITKNGFSLRYSPFPNPDSACKIAGKATDMAGDPAVQGPSVLSNQGTYSGPSTSSLKGTGDISLMRTCSWSNRPNPFHRLTVTYISQASVEVTWTH